MAAKRTYLAIDLKSFYASVECVDRHLDPLTTNLVVADASRTEKTICLAVHLLQLEIRPEKCNGSRRIKHEEQIGEISHECTERIHQK